MKIDLELLRATTSAMIASLPINDNPNPLKKQLIKHRNTIDLMMEESITDNEDFLRIIDQCKREQHEAFMLIRVFADKVMSRATLFSALTDLAEEIIKLRSSR